MARADESGPGNEDVGQLKKQVSDLQKQVESLTQVVSVTNGLETIGAGLANLVGELAPLRQLVPPRVSEALPEATTKALLRLRMALASPRWADVVSLDVDGWDVGFIGQANPPLGRVEQVGAAQVAEFGIYELGEFTSGEDEEQ